MVSHIPVEKKVACTATILLIFLNLSIASLSAPSLCEFLINLCPDNYRKFSLYSLFGINGGRIPGRNGKEYIFLSFFEEGKPSRPFFGISYFIDSFSQGRKIRINSFSFQNNKTYDWQGKPNLTRATALLNGLRRLNCGLIGRLILGHREIRYENGEWVEKEMSSAPGKTVMTKPIRVPPELMPGKLSINTE